MVSSPEISDSSRGTYRWLVYEGSIIAGITLLWAAVAFIVTGLLGLIKTGFIEMGGADIGFVNTVNSTVWEIASLVAVASAFLYVLVRAGLIILDEYPDSATE